MFLVYVVEAYSAALQTPSPAVPRTPPPRDDAKPLPGDGSKRSLSDVWGALKRALRLSPPHTKFTPLRERAVAPYPSDTI